jgi:chemotaxis protein methyltransferase CheR
VILRANPSFDAILGLMESRTGLQTPLTRRRAAEGAVSRAMAARRISDLSTYFLELENPAVLDELANELTIKETYFFRDVHQLDAIAKTVLPEIIARRGPDHVLRLWSAGCATGEEAYSLAMLLDHEGLASRARVLGTDLSRGARPAPRPRRRGAGSTATGRCAGQGRRRRDRT